MFGLKIIYFQSKGLTWGFELWENVIESQKGEKMSTIQMSTAESHICDILFLPTYRQGLAIFSQPNKTSPLELKRMYKNHIFFPQFVLFAQQQHKLSPLRKLCFLCFSKKLNLSVHAWWPLYMKFLVAIDHFSQLHWQKNLLCQFAFGFHSQWWKGLKIKWQEVKSNGITAKDFVHRRKWKWLNGYF